MNTHVAPSNPFRRREVLQFLAGGCLILGTGWLWQNTAQSAEKAIEIPPPALDLPPSQGLQKAIFAGGCFWGVQGVYQHVKGVLRAESGYSGGTAETAAYELVTRSNTGHAESVEITYDPAQVSYGTLLQIFFSVTHDPTQLNRQGPDVGPQYRSAIFATSPAQLKVANAYINQLDATKRFGKPIVTQRVAAPSFYAAEIYHQDFMTEHPHNPYIVINDLPKVANLKRLFPERYRSEPALIKISH